MIQRLLLLTLLFSSVTLFSQVTRNGCTSQPLRIVVLGSSTAAGAGASASDSAWVNRYRAALQSINPDNEVINLGVGGFTTYRIMPNSFVTPANRPLVDTTKNITRALSLSPDAIIVNLPSNDRQWPASEQLANFDSLYRHSWSQGVPMYICTTQPITTSGTYQKVVRDSILARFGVHAIDVFSPLTDSLNLIQPQFAADAVHLNDLGHRTLFQTIYNKDLLKDIVTPLAGVDFQIVQLAPLAGRLCPGFTSLTLTYANVGDTSTGAITGRAWVAGVDSTTFPLSPILSCGAGNTSIQFSHLPPGQHELIVRVDVTNDIDTLNNVDTLVINVAGYGLSGFDSIHYFCPQDTFYVPSHNADGDSLVWFDATTGQLLPYSPILLTGTHRFEYKSYTYPRTLRDEVHLSSNPNISWYGNMFNVVADTNLTLNEFRFLSGSAGTSYPLIHITNGSYIGKEGNAGAWTLASADTLTGLAVDDSISLPLNLRMNKGDTLGIYVHFGNVNHRLKYQSASSGSTFTGSELHILAGTGVSHNYGTTYAHRILAGSLQYEWGFDSIGRCSYPRRPIEFTPDTIVIDFPDTLTLGHGFTLQVSPLLSQISWYSLSTGALLSSGALWQIDSTLFPSTGPLLIHVEGVSPFGCTTSDTIVLYYSGIGLEDVMDRYQIYPNPSKGLLHVDGVEEAVEYRIYTLAGIEVQYGNLTSSSSVIQTHELPEGIYVLSLTKGDRNKTFRMILTYD